MEEHQSGHRRFTAITTSRGCQRVCETAQKATVTLQATWAALLMGSEAAPNKSEGSGEVWMGGDGDGAATPAHSSLTCKHKNQDAQQILLQ